MSELSRRGLRPVPLVGSLVLGGLAVWLRLGARTPLGFTLADVGFWSWRLWWFGASALIAASMLGALASARVPQGLGRAGSAVAFFLGTVLLAASEIGDPATALAVGGCLGVLSALVGFIAFGVEGEGGVVWIGVIAVGCAGIMVGALIAGTLAEAASGGALWASAALEFFGVGTLAVFGAVPAAAVFFLQDHLERWDVPLLNALAGGLLGVLLAGALRG